MNFVDLEVQVRLLVKEIFPEVNEFGARIFDKSGSVSLDRVALAVAVEKKWNISLSVSEIISKEFETVDGLVGMIFIKITNR